MALVHFAFGAYAREGKIDRQVEMTCEHILGKRTLKGAKCPEFLPILTNKGAVMGAPKSFSALGNGGVSPMQWVPSPPVMLMPDDAWMISFTDLPVKKLPNWPCIEYYGELAIIFSNEFRKRVGARRVEYYELSRLPYDKLVIKLNDSIKDGKLDRNLSTKCLNFRKPRVLWSEFKELFGVVEVKFGQGEASVAVHTYDRYPVGYQFEKEREVRVVMRPDDLFLPFEETDVVGIIAPNEDSAIHIRSFCKNNWSVVPDVRTLRN